MNGLLALLQLVSPAFPVGAYAYSQGQEYAIDCGDIRDAESAARWIGAALVHGLPQLELPLLLRLHRAWNESDIDAVQHWNRQLLAMRETRELRLEETQMGEAILRLMRAMEIPAAQQWPADAPCAYLTGFALYAAHAGVDQRDTLAGYAWAWLENQVSVALKAIPLGQTDGQKILLRWRGEIPALVARALEVADEDIGQALPMLAIASAQHESQYSRLFRS